MNEDQNVERNFYEALNRSLDKVTLDQFLYGQWVQGEKVTITSTATNQPATSMTKENLIEALGLIKKGDVLQQKGVGRDWFCVINPALVTPIKEMAKQYVKVPSYVMSIFELDYIMGRRVLIVNEAPLNIEYMDEPTARGKYPDHFEQEELPRAISQVKRIIEFNEGIFLDVRIESKWTFFRYFITENDPEPFQVKKIATKIFDEMDWSYAAMLIMQAPSEPK